MSDVRHPFEADRTAADRLLAQCAGIAAGCFRAASGSRAFQRSGPLHGWYVVFPRNHTCIFHRDGEQVVGNPAQLNFYFCGDDYRRRPISHEGDHSDYLLFDEAAWRSLLDEVAPAGRFSAGLRLPRRVAPLPRPLLSRQRELYRCLDADPSGSALRREEGLLWIAALALSQAVPEHAADVRRSATRHRHRRLVEQAKERLIAALDAPPPLTELATSLNSSPFHLARIFLRETGFTLHSFVVEQRLRLAFDRVRDGCGSLTELATDLGFSHPSHFSNWFRRAFGIAPSVLRRSA